jgi:hypothetical protein
MKHWAMLTLACIGFTAGCGGDDDGGGSGGSSSGGTGGTTSGGTGGTSAGGTGGGAAGAGGSMAGAGGSTGGAAGAAGAGGSTGGAAGAGGGAAGAGGGVTKDCNGAQFVASCTGNNSSSGTCIDFYEKWTVNLVTTQCSAMGPGTLDQANKCTSTGYFGACARVFAQSCQVTYMGAPTYPSASNAQDACKGINGTWYPN